jgi:hypothetical protein
VCVCVCVYVCINENGQQACVCAREWLCVCTRCCSGFTHTHTHTETHTHTHTHTHSHTQVPKLHEWFTSRQSSAPSSRPPASALLMVTICTKRGRVGGRGERDRPACVPGGWRERQRPGEGGGERPARVPPPRAGESDYVQGDGGGERERDKLTSPRLLSSPGDCKQTHTFKFCVADFFLKKNVKT